MRQDDDKALIFGVYSRKSLFTGKGESIEAQINFAKEYVNVRSAKFGNQIKFEIYRDEGFSGKNMDRPDFKRLMEDVRNRKINYVICYRLDRISRDVGDFAGLIQELNLYGVSFISVKEEFDTTSPIGRAMMYLASIFAQLERETIAERVRDNYYELARKGRWMGGIPPVGYKAISEENLILDDGRVKKSYFLEQVQEECSHVKMIADEFLELQSFNGVCRYLKNNGIRTKGGHKYISSTIRDVLTNPVYCIADKDAYQFVMDMGAECCFDEADFNGQHGLIAYRKREQSLKSKQRLPMEQWLFSIGKHQGILSGKEWIKIQKLIQEKKQPHRSNINSHNDYALLSGMIICKECGGPMYCYKYNKTTGQFYYICKNKNDALADVSCRSKNLPGVVIDQLVLDILLDYDVPGSWLAKKLEAMYLDSNDTNNAEQQINKLEKSISRAKKELDNYAQILGRENINEMLLSAVNEKCNMVSEEIKEWERTLEDLKNEGNIHKKEKENIDQMIQSLTKLKAHKERLSLGEKRQIIRNLIDYITWDGENLDIFTFGQQYNTSNLLAAK